MNETMKQRDLGWQRIQAATGLVFAVFVAAHLGNTVLAIAGTDVYDGAQRALRAVYQHPIVEIALLGVVVPLHLAAGFVRSRLRKAGPRRPVPLSLRLHRYAGWFLALVVYFHVAAVRLPAVLYDAWPGFAGISFSLHFVPAWFYPYYFILALAGFYHAANGSRLAVSRLAARPPAFEARRLPVLAGIAAVALAASLLAFGGVLYDVPDPFVSPYARVYLDWLGMLAP